jgi:DHA3 family macrolide efflux protein-like MFS transporter
MEPLSDTPTTAAPVEERALPDRLWNRGFFLLWQGQTISQFGNLAFTFAMMLWLKDATGSASLMGFMMFASLLPGVALGPFGGTFADRHPRIRIALVCDLLSGAAVLVLAFSMFDPRVTSLQPGAVRFVIGLLFGVSVVTGILKAFFIPALTAAIPDLVPRDKIPAANSLNQFSVQGSTLLGQAIGGLAYQLLGAPLLFLIDGLSFLYAGICSGFIRLPPMARKPAAEHPFREFLKETGDGFRYLWNRPGLRDFIAIASVVNFFGMPIAVLLPFYVEMYLKADDKWYGFLMAFIGAGSVAGFILAGTLPLAGQTRYRAIFAAMVLAPVFFGALGFVTDPYLAMVLVFLGGAAIGVINVYLMSMIQASTPDEVRGRVLGVVMTLSSALMPIGMVVGGIVGDLTGKNVPLVYGVCGGGALAASLFGLRRDLREFLTNG